MITYARAVIIGLLQGVTELFPVSSLGHSVLIPALLGWDDLVKGQSADGSRYLTFLIGLHVATAIALIVVFRRDWDRIIRGLLRSIRRRKVETADERLGWLLIIATIPVGVIGLALEKPLRSVFAKPTAAAVFLMVNGLILLAGERTRRNAGQPAVVGGEAEQATHARERASQLDVKEAGVIGTAQALALFAGISRSGVTMVAGLARGLDHEDAARFSFLLATPVILAAGLYKLPDLLGHQGDGMRGQVLVGAIAAGLAAYVAAKFLVRYFETRTLTPFAIYCLVAGAAMTIRFTLF